MFLFLWLVLLGYVVPDGRSLSPRWRRWVIAGLVGVAAFLVGSAGDAEGFRAAHHGTAPPLPWLPAAVSVPLGVVGLVLTVLLFFGAVFAVGVRLHRSSGDVRLQLLWLVWGSISLPLALVLAWIAHFVFGDNAVLVDVALTSAGTALPATIGIAILRHRLFDIQVVLSRTLTYGVLVAAVVGLYGLLLLGANRLLGDSAAGGLLAVGVVAVTVQPAVAMMRRRIERWVYGYRSDPALALRRLGAKVESADPLHVIEILSTSIAEALKVDRVRVEVPGDPVADATRSTRVPLVNRGDRVAIWSSMCRQVAAGRPQIPRYWATSPGMPRSPSERPSSPETCRFPERGSSLPARRNANGCAATSMTDWDQPWLRSCSSFRPHNRAVRKLSVTTC